MDPPDSAPTTEFLDVHDALVRRLFAVSLDLHSALTRIDDQHAADRVGRAIGGLDEAIRSLRGNILQLSAAAPAAGRRRGVLDERPHDGRDASAPQGDDQGLADAAHCFVGSVVGATVHEAGQPRRPGNGKPLRPDGQVGASDG